MTLPEDNTEDDDVFMKLAEDDVKLTEELVTVTDNYEKTMDVLQRRRILYRKYYTLPLEPIETEMILTQDRLIQMEMALATTRHELQTDVAKLISRIDDLESER